MNIKLTKWLREAEINIDEIIKILQDNKPLRSMEVFRKLKKIDTSMDCKFAQFSKLLCGVLPQKRMVKVISTSDGVFYTVNKHKK